MKKFGRIKGNQRYACKNMEYSHKTFYAEYSYNGYKSDVKRDIIKWLVDGAGVRAISRELGIIAVNGENIIIDVPP